MTAKNIDPAIKQWATETQSSYIDAVNKHGSQRAAARALGVSQKAVWQSIEFAKRRAAASGYSPDHDMIHAVPAPFYAKGVSTNYGQDGEVKQQWVKSSIDEGKRVQIILDYLDARSKEIPALTKISTPKSTQDKLCNLYTMTDCHVGMLAWGKETGEPWDLKIAEKTLVGCFSAMLDQSPDARVGVVNQLGDFMHVDKIEPLTPASAHLLDADIRFPKIIDSALNILEWIVTESLKKHKEVHLVCAEGNHDPVSAQWMTAHFRRLFRDNPRITVNDAKLPYYTYQHGSTMLAFHHGHKKKPAELPLMFAAREAKMWGDTKYRYGHSGHMHNQIEVIKEYNGMKWRQHPTLAAPDAYSARGGWVSKREASAITYHSDYGQVGEVTVSPEMVTGR